VAYMDYSLRTTGYAGIAAAVSGDGGDTWQHSVLPLPPDFDEGAANPIARFDDEGRLFVSFMAATFPGAKPPPTHPDFHTPPALGLHSNNGIFVVQSDDGGWTWQPPVAVAAHRFDDQEVPFDVIPELAVDTFPTLPDGQPNPNRGNLYAAWTRNYPAGQ